MRETNKASSLAKTTVVAPRTWRAADLGIFVHADECASCDDHSAHVHTHVALGEMSSLITAYRLAAHQIIGRMTLPMDCTHFWNDHLSGTLPFPACVLAFTPASLLGAYANVLPQGILFLKLQSRLENLPPWQTESDIPGRQRRILEYTELLREVTQVDHDLLDMAVPNMFTALSEVTPPAIWNALPPRIVGLGHDRLPVYPISHTIQVPGIGPVSFIRPNRCLTPFEFEEAPRTLLLVVGAGGHPHLPGSLWAQMPHVACGLDDLRKGVIPLPKVSPADEMRLCAEAMHVPWLERSPAQRGVSHRVTMTRYSKDGVDALNTFIRDDIGAHDLNEQVHAIADMTDIPLFIEGTIVRNNWRWDEQAIQTWAIMTIVFDNVHDAIRALKVAKIEQPKSLKAVPRYAIRPYGGTELQPGQVVHHLIYKCGIPPAEVRIMARVAQSWDDLNVQRRSMERRALWQSMRANGDNNLLGQRLLVTRPDDPPFDMVTPQIALKRIDECRPFMLLGDAHGRTSSSSSTHHNAGPSQQYPAARTADARPFKRPFRG